MLHSVVSACLHLFGWNVFTTLPCGRGRETQLSGQRFNKMTLIVTRSVRTCSWRKFTTLSTTDFARKHSWSSRYDRPEVERVRAREKSLWHPECIFTEGAVTHKKTFKKGPGRGRRRRVVGRILTRRALDIYNFFLYASHSHQTWWFFLKFNLAQLDIASLCPSSLTLPCQPLFDRHFF